MQTYVSPALIEAAPYLLLHTALLAVAVLIRTVAYFWTQAGRTAFAPHSLNRYDVALLTGNLYRVVETALVGLVDAGAVTIHPGAVTEFRPRPDAARRVQDAVRHEVLELLPNSPNLHLLTLRFRRTQAAIDLRQRLCSAGFLIMYPGLTLVTRCVRALFLLSPVATIVAAWSLTSDGRILLLIFGIVVTIVVWVWAESVLPLARTRQAKQWAKTVNRALRAYQREAAKDGQTERALRDAQATMSARATELGLSAGWIDAPNSMVPFLGWSAYRDNDGNDIEPQRYWQPASGVVPQRSEQHRQLGLLYRVLGATSGLIAVVCGSMALTGNLLFVLLFLVFSGLGVRLATLGKKHRAIDGRQLLGTRGRPPVLYLRSFAHDSLLEQTPPLRAIMTALGSRLSYIEELVVVVRGFGDLVAIDNPGTPLPGLGPAYIDVPSDSDPGRSLARWQAEVLSLMDSAALVLISAGQGHGLRWEFAQATSRVPPEKLVLFVPLDRAEYERFRQHTGNYFRLGLPVDPRKHDKNSGESIFGLIYFDRDWTPHFVELRRHPLVQLHLGRAATRVSMRRIRNRLAHAMYPVFRSNRVRWPGIAIPVPFGRNSRHRVVPGLSLARTIVLASAVGIALALLNNLSA